ncbi:Chromatin remodeling factor mit1 [Paramyrothecium foliicola]|nr:Chromatin remodeling factor mit1 [Paramyrothecium foliicola]
MEDIAQSPEETDLLQIGEGPHSIGNDAGDDNDLDAFLASLETDGFIVKDVGAPAAAPEPLDEYESDAQGTCKPSGQMQVAIPEIPLARRAEYQTVLSEVIEAVLDEITADGDSPLYQVQFTDGRDELISYADALLYQGGTAALTSFRSQDLVSMSEGSRKRKLAPDDDWSSVGDDGVSDGMDLDDADSDMDDLEAEVIKQRKSNIKTRSFRPRETSSRTTPMFQSLASDEDELGRMPDSPPQRPERKLRERYPRQVKLTEMPFQNSLGDSEPDQPMNDYDAEDGDFAPVTSDVLPPGRPSRARQPTRRLHSRAARQRSRIQSATTRRSPDSDIEFEAPRRSGRSTRTKHSMRDDDLMDDDSFFIEDDKIPAIPKVVSIRESFQPVAADTDFGTMHMQSCHTCNGSKQRGQLVYCQGCSLTYHRQCLGVRSAREHLATKIDEEEFVLQCKFCIGTYLKKDRNAPKHSICQGCRKPGRACAPFSERKTARQEEKLREENGGVDPITKVSPDLVNNANVVLVRCTTCHRGWHLEHLGSDNDSPVGTDFKTESFKDFAIDWQCNDCSTAKHKIHRLVAWRPVGPASQHHGFKDISDDEKEYLIKWETLSYFHCSWMPGAWVFGVAASTMRSSFAKKAVEQDLLKPSEKEAIPDEYLMPDIILNAKLDNSAPRTRTREAELENVGAVSKALIKFQGLGYDDVVWDSPPPQDQNGYYQSFVDAYYEFVEGKYFQHDSRAKIRERVKAFKSSEFKEVNTQPAGLKRGKLMGYQLEGLNWLLENYHQGRSVVLADEMGLGKTVQVVSLVTYLVQDEPKCWPFLIVVPNATCPNWRREFKQWAPDLRVVTYHGGKEPQELAYKYELFPGGSSEMKAHAVIMSYDSAQDPRTRTLFQSVHWAGMVVDEGQRLKNDQSLLYLALRAMKIPFRLLLTGTPLQNNKRELFNLLQFIDETQDATKLDEEYEILDKETLPRLHEKIRPYFLRRTKAGVLKFLPPMAQIIIPVTMTVIQEKLSKSIMAKNPQLIRAVFANSKMNRTERGSLNNILMQLRKCLCHPFMYSEAIEERHHDPAILHRNLVEASAKLLLMEIMLPKLHERGHRVLIFSQFLQQLDIVEDFLNGMGYQYRRLDGGVSSLEKQRRIDAFNEPDSSIFVFLLSTRAGGVGINLATADTVIIMDPDFNPHQDIQALSRAHRIGQKKKVLCFQLVTKDSVEERIMQTGRKKMALDHALIESMDDNDLEGDDLESILKHGAQALFNDDYQKSAIHYDATSVEKLLDRSEVEQTETNEERSAEAQFSFARVWANDKNGFEDGLATQADEAPEPINSSVWDKILAQREEEARREEAANREVLGRGGRRRLAINYKTTAPEQIAMLEGMEAESSDSSDGFATADSTGESDDEPDAKDPSDQPQDAKPQIRHGKVSSSVKDTHNTHKGQGQNEPRFIDPRTQKARHKPSKGAAEPPANANQVSQHFTKQTVPQVNQQIQHQQHTAPIYYSHGQAHVVPSHQTYNTPTQYNQYSATFAARASPSQASYNAHCQRKVARGCLEGSSKMDKVLSILASFPPPRNEIDTAKKYDAAIRSHVATLSKVLETSPAGVSNELGQVLEGVDPSVNSIGFLAILDFISKQAETNSSFSRTSFLDKILEFLMTFDPIQIRYGGRQLLGLLDAVAAGNLFTFPVAAEVLASVILRIDPSGSVFTSTHLLLAKLAVEKGLPDSALTVIDKDITLYPNMGGAKETRPLCDENLGPSAYISSASSLSNTLKSTFVLEYHLLCGLIYVAKRNWPQARKSFERVIVHPTKDKGVSAMMIEGYKKWVLVGLLSEGQAPSLPAYTAATTKNSFNTLATSYNNVATLFATDNAAEFKAEVEANQNAWEEDGNTSLMNEVVGAYQEWQIIKLQRVYREITIPRIRQVTLSARTGEPLKTDDEVVRLIQKMIGSRMLNGEIAPGENSELFLRFGDDSIEMTESEFARRLAQSQAAITQLSKQFQVTNERLSENKEYAKYLLREQKRLDKEMPDAAIGFDSQIEDEDLMTGIPTVTGRPETIWCLLLHESLQQVFLVEYSLKMTSFKSSRLTPSRWSLISLAVSAVLSSGAPLSTNLNTSLTTLREKPLYFVTASGLHKPQESIGAPREEELIVLPESVPSAFEEEEPPGAATTETSTATLAENASAASSDGTIASVEAAYETQEKSAAPRSNETANPLTREIDTNSPGPCPLTRELDTNLKAPNPLARELDTAGSSVNTTGHVQSKRSWPSVFIAVVNLVNATPYRWRRGYIHSYQIPRWKKDWPEYIDVGESAEVSAKVFVDGPSKDTAGEVVYHLEGTSKPMSFMVEYRKGKKHQFWIKFLDDLETIRSPKHSELNLGLQRDPGGIGFVLAGKEGDFISNDPPISWMQAQLPLIGHLPLREIVMPMSHHAGLWKSVKRIGFGMPINTQTHNAKLDDQIINSGVRVLDVRPAKFDGDWREGHGTKLAGVWHGVLGAKLEEMIDIVNKFCDEHPGELFIWDVHPTHAWNGDRNFRGLDDWDRWYLYRTFKRLKHRVSVPDNEDLTAWPLNRFIGNKTSAVLVRFDESWTANKYFPGGAEGFVTNASFPLSHRWSETGSASKMAADQLKHLRASRPGRGSRLFRSDWLLTQVGVKAVLPQESIRTLAGAAWRALYRELWQGVTGETYPNWIAMDAMHGNELKAMVMAMNHCLVAKRCGDLNGKVVQPRNQHQE